MKDRNFVKEIEKLRTAVLGYDREEVVLYIRELVEYYGQKNEEAVRELYLEKMQLAAENAGLRAQIPTQEKLYAEADGKAEEILGGAKETAATILDHAGTEKERMLKEAGEAEKRILAEADQKAGETIAEADQKAGETLAEADRKAGETLTEAERKAGEILAEAGRQAEEILARLRGGELPENVVKRHGPDGDTYFYNCPVSDTQLLEVEVRLQGADWTVLRWQTVSTADWQAEDTLDLWDGDPVAELGI